MFAKKNRYSFRDALPKNILNSRSFNVRYGKNDGELKVAVVVSKKVDKRAVVRNKIKRAILEAVRKNLGMDIGLTLVFYAKRQAVESSNLDQEIETALLKIK